VARRSSLPSAFSAAVIAAAGALLGGCPGLSDRGLKDVDPTVRASAIKSYPARSDGSDVTAIVELLTDEDAGVAWVAWHELARRTGVKFGSPRSEADRREAAAGWLGWLAARGRKPGA
jgi:hypothetical protein